MFGKIWCQPKYLVLYPKDLGMEHNEIVDRVYSVYPSTECLFETWIISNIIVKIKVMTTF